MDSQTPSLHKFPMLLPNCCSSAERLGAVVEPAMGSFTGSVAGSFSPPVQLPIPRNNTPARATAASAPARYFGQGHTMDKGGYAMGFCGSDRIYFSSLSSQGSANSKFNRKPPCIGRWAISAGRFLGNSKFLSINGITFSPVWKACANSFRTQSSRMKRRFRLFFVSTTKSTSLFSISFNSAVLKEPPPRHSMSKNTSYPRAFN